MECWNYWRPCFASVFLTTTPAAGRTRHQGRAFPSFANFELEGELPKELKGKLVIVDFWASWCGPCRGTFPLMEDLHRRRARADS